MRLLTKLFIDHEVRNRLDASQIFVKFANKNGRLTANATDEILVISIVGLAYWVEKECYLEAGKGIKPTNVDSVTRKINSATKSYNERKTAFKRMIKIFKLDK